mmetsp:Transcript_1784/g.2699  ORF Transcript_1784/g.2699 Transcript_1784/m.2699 type:complete len:170 (-) Transcript_1784:57-566(-)
MLHSIGFSDEIADEPLLLVCGAKEQAKTGKCLFGRRLSAARQPFGTLTTERLQEHNAQDSATPHSLPAEKAANTGEWLTYFKGLAREAPVQELTAHMFGPEIGLDVAGFIGADVMDNRSDLQMTSPDPGDGTDGRRVIGSRYAYFPRATHHGGCTSFVIDDDVSISTQR